MGQIRLDLGSRVAVRVIAVVVVLYVDEVVGLTTVDGLDIAALAVGVLAIEVAQQHLELHIVIGGRGMEIVVVACPVAGPRGQYRHGHKNCKEP